MALPRAAKILQKGFCPIDSNIITGCKENCEQKNPQNREYQRILGNPKEYLSISREHLVTPEVCLGTSGNTKDVQGTPGNTQYMLGNTRQYQRYSRD